MRIGEISLRFRGKDTCGGEAEVVDQKRVRVTVPLDRVRRAGNDRLEWFIVPVCWTGESVAVGQVELLIVHVVQEHVDAGKIARSRVDLLTVEALSNVTLAKNGIHAIIFTMRICLVNDYSLELIGGAVVSMFEQKKSLEMMGHTVKILQLGTQVHSNKMNFDKSDIVFIKPSMTLPRLAYNLPILYGSKRNRRIVFNNIKKGNFDIIHFQSEMSLAFTAKSVADELKIPTVMTVHTFFWQYQGKFAFGLISYLIKKIFGCVIKQKLAFCTPIGNKVEQTMKRFTFTLANSCNVVISPSSHQATAMLDAGLTTQCHTLPNPFSADSALPPAKLISKSNEPVKFIWIGRFVPEKRPLKFIEAIKLARKATNLPFTVDFYGAGAELATAQSNNQDPSIIFYGKKTHIQTVTAIDSSDIVVLSSYHFDNQPMIIAEGVARFRGILYCDERLTEGLQHSGSLSVDESPSSMAKAMVDLVSNRNKIIQLSEGAKIDGKIFSAKFYGSAISKIYNRLQ